METPIISINQEPYWTLISPNGTPQLGMLCEDEESCIATIRMYHKFGLGKSLFELKRKGFRLAPVLLTIHPVAGPLNRG